MNLHSSTELSRGWISGTFGNAPVECIDERFRITGARHVVEKPAGYQNLPLEIRGGVGKVDKGCVGAERLTFGESRRYAAAFRRGGSDQHLGGKEEEPVKIADGRGQDAQAPQHGWRAVASIVGIEHAGSGDRFCTAAALRHFENEIAFGRYRHRDRKATRRRNEQLGAVAGGRIVNGRVGVAVLAHADAGRSPFPSAAR